MIGNFIGIKSWRKILERLKWKVGIFIGTKNIFNRWFKRKIDTIYYNGEKSNMLFMVQVDVIVFGLTDQLDQITNWLNHRDTKRMKGVEYWCPSIDSAENVQFTETKLKNNDDVRTTFFLFNQYSSKIPSIKLDTYLIKSFKDIQK